ncbi:MAG: hypothetical protein F4Y03_13920 [Alphaproteobacteria bacterium]|nr:hypothetical protein [Alphaproteobacteria bacterium]
MSAVRLYRARADEVTLAWTVEAWRRLGLGPGAALFTTAEGVRIAPFEAGPPLVEAAFDARMIADGAELRWLAARRRAGVRTGPAVLVGEARTPLVEGFARLEPHDAHPREVGYTVPAILHGEERPVSAALCLVEYVDSADPDHPGRVDERLAAALILEEEAQEAADAVSPPW